MLEVGYSFYFIFSVKSYQLSTYMWFEHVQNIQTKLLARHHIQTKDYFQTIVNYYNVLYGPVTVLLGFGPVLRYLEIFISTHGQYLLQMIRKPNTICSMLIIISVAGEMTRVFRAVR